MALTLDSWRGAELPPNYVDITEQVDIKGLDLLNYASEFGSARTLFGATKPPALSSAGEEDNESMEWVESDVDEQLMLFMPFRAAVSIHSIQITSLPPRVSGDGGNDDEIPMRPRTIQLYKNQPNNVGFDAAEDALVDQIITLGPRDWNEATGTAKLELRFVNFQNVTSLVMFMFDGEGHGEKIRIDRIRIIGKSGEEKKMGKLMEVGPIEKGSADAFMLFSDESLETYNHSLLRAGRTDIKRQVRAVERATELTLDGYPHEELEETQATDPANMLCTYCAAAENTWRRPQIAKIFRMDFGSPIVKTPAAEHHENVAALRDCASKQKCPLCKLIYAEIVMSARKAQRRIQPNDKKAKMTTSLMRSVNAGTRLPHAITDLKDDSLQAPLGHLVFSAPGHDADVGEESAVIISSEEQDPAQLLEGEITISLMSSDWNSGTGPSLQIGIGQSPWAHLDIHPLKDSVGNILTECSTMEDSNTSSDASFKTASAWLEECISSHTLCSQYQGIVTQLPSRVIDVGPFNGSQEPYLHVRYEGQRDRYLTLSHRWGYSKSLENTKTVRGNYKQNRTAISFSTLPLTFQHAITITRKFGYKYLWIDSLCIIQDSKEDWESESYRMGDIYRRADFTIATVDASSADSGCFFPRDGQTIRPCRLDIYRPPEDRDTFCNSPGKIFVSRRVRFDNQRSNYRRHSSLDSRGWCLQERALSTRTLSYSKDGLFWECVTTDASELIPDGIEPDMHTSDNEYMRDLRKEAIAILKKEQYGEARDIHQAWRLLVQDYSRRSLTKDSDKLIALAGVINSLSGPKSDMCVAGAWEKQLRSDLLWLVFTKTTVLKPSYYQGPCPPAGPRSRRLPSSVAPTWSWASVHGHICFPIDGRHDLLSKVSFGPPAPGSAHQTIIATGVLVKARTCACGGTCDPAYVKQEKKDLFHHSLDDKIEHLRDASNTRRVADWFPDDGDASYAVLYCLPLARHLGTIKCLALVPADGLEGKYYQRVGLGLWSVSDWDSLCSEMKSVEDNGTRELERTVHIL